MVRERPLMSKTQFLRGARPRHLYARPLFALGTPIPDEILDCLMSRIVYTHRELHLLNKLTKLKYNNKYRKELLGE